MAPSVQVKTLIGGRFWQLLLTGVVLGIALAGGSTLVTKSPVREPTEVLTVQTTPVPGEVVVPPTPGEVVRPADLELPELEPPTIVLPPVRAEQPRLKVGASGDDPNLLRRVRQVEGVSVATLVEVAEVPIAGATGPTTMRMAAVTPEDFRPLTPQVTADATGVWERLSEGDAAFTHDAGHRLEVPLGAEVPAAGDSSIRIGAYASNGVPPIADAIISEQTGQRLGLEGQHDLLIAIREDADPAQVAARIAKITGAQPTVLDPPRAQRAFLTGADARLAFEPYSYVDRGDGTIQIDADWVRRNIVRARVPIFRGEVVCHRLMIDQLRGALQEVQDRGLGSLIDVNDYGGCWVPRHIDWDPFKPLSMHSWGLAIDFNVATNGLGRTPTLDPRIVEVFERWGFVWGGRWSRPDGMHFELGALLNSPQG